MIVNGITYESGSDDESDLRSQQRSNPYLATLAHISTAASVPAPRPKSDQPKRLQQFWEAFNAKETNGVIDEKIVRAYIYDYGCPEKPSGMRGLIWKLLLGYLSWDRKEWRSQLAKQRQIYQAWVQELINNPFAQFEPTPSASPSQPSLSPLTNSSSSSSGAKTSLKFEKISSMDDPLSTKTDSSWSKYYADNTIRDEIEKDVRRTYSNFHFFCLPVKPQESSPEEIRKRDAIERQKMAEENERNNRSTSAHKNFFDDVTLKQVTAAKDSAVPSVPKVELAAPSRRQDDFTHHDVIKRILFIYAKLNPGIRYIQGMNELLAPVYYVFAHDGCDFRRFDPATGELIADDSCLLEHTSDLFASSDTAESDAFFCFTSIMSQMRDRFIKSLDLSPTGVLSAIGNLNLLLKRIDPPLWAHLQQIGCDPRFYSFRWLTLLLSQEFELPDVLRLWDTLFAAEPEATREGIDTLAQVNPNAAKKAMSPTTGSSSSSGDDTSNMKLIVEHLNDVCCSMLVMSRDILLDADFSIALKTLQSAGSGLDIQRLLFKAHEIRRTRLGILASEGGLTSAASTTVPPSPLKKEDLNEFTEPVPRPGDTPKSKRTNIHIPLVTALTDPVTIKRSQQPTVTATPMVQKSSSITTSSPSPSLTPSPSPSPPTPSDLTSSASAASTSAPSTSVSDVLHVAAQSATSLVSDLGHLVVTSAEASAPVLKHAAEQVKEAGKAIVEQVTHSIEEEQDATATQSSASNDTDATAQSNGE